MFWWRIPLKYFLLGLPIASNGEKLLFKSDATAVLHASTWHLTKQQSLETAAALKVMGNNLRPPFPAGGSSGQEFCGVSSTA